MFKIYEENRIIKLITHDIDLRHHIKVIKYQIWCLKFKIKKFDSVTEIFILLESNH